MTKGSTGGMTLFVITLLAVSQAAPTRSQAVFATPDEAISALLTALVSGDYPLFLSVAGPRMARFWNTTDQESGDWDRERFVEAACKRGLQMGPAIASRTMVYAGDRRDSFPAPLIRTDAGWRFDDDAGSRELVTRRMRRNETAVIEVCQRFREAEYKFLAMPSEGASSFAKKIRSTPGEHDGLFWSGPGEEDESPVGPPFAAAALAERQPGDDTRPLFGYYFKILSAQGHYAAGGVLDYRIDGQLRKGFALVAWPAEYGVVGTQSFLINHSGDIYLKDLGPGTSRIVEEITTFNPDPSWRRFSAPD